MVDTGTVLAVAQLAGALAGICGKYIKEVKNAKQEILQLQDQIEALRKVLESLSRLLEDPSHLDCLGNTRKLDGDIDRCRSTLENLKKKIELVEIRGAMRKIGIRLKWPLDSDEVTVAIKSIKNYRSYFNSTLQLDQT